VLVQLTGDLAVGDLLAHLRDTLGTGGFLENETFESIRDERHRVFAAEAARRPVHAGGAYPTDAGALHALLDRYLEAAPRVDPGGAILGIAAPHVSLEGGWRSYGAAYGLLPQADASRTFVILGTSHYGRADTFGITRKSFQTPLGATAVDLEIVDRLIADGGEAVSVEDYCHSIEHSIEFQVVFLQHLFGPSVRIVPILCGPFARATGSGWPEDDPGVERFLGALGALAAREGDRLRWILGVDMAHMGRRYGDRWKATAGRGPMEGVAERDRERCQRIADGNARGFWEALREEGDPLKWCGASPFYTFLAAARPPRGRLLHYEQWNIDDESVVSFAGMAFPR
jgi:AmmeMemoRadiSam system protein B